MTYIIGYITYIIGEGQVLEKLFGGKNIEKVFFFLLINQRCYGQQLSRIFKQSVSPFQKTFARLEKGSIVVRFLEGKTRMYQFNPRYPFLSELKAFIAKAYEFLPEEQKEKYYEPKIRKRPRKRGKLL